jgi:hypothetical protein
MHLRGVQDPELWRIGLSWNSIDFWKLIEGEKK